MNAKEIEELLKNIKDKYSYEPYDNTGNVYTTISYEEGQLLLSYIEQLEKENQQLKKQKDDVVEYIKNNAEEYKWEDDDGAINVDYCCDGFVILRMLGEIDD